MEGANSVLGQESLVVAKRYRNRDWLYHKYWPERLSANQIADLCGVSNVTIHHWMRKLGVPRRSAAQAIRIRTAKYTDWGRVCVDCRIYKPWDKFAVDYSRPMNRNNRCRSCWAVRACRQQRAFREDNPELYRERERIQKQRRRARERSAPGTLTQADIDRLYKAYGARCMNCGATKRLEIDHVVPLSKGGAHHISNIQILCKSCNSSKGTEIIDFRPSTNSSNKET